MKLCMQFFSMNTDINKPVYVYTTMQHDLRGIIEGDNTALEPQCLHCICWINIK